LQDTGVFINFLNRQEQVLPGKIAITGYCMGGSLAIRAAARYPDRVAAVASFHAGNLATETPDSPYRLLGQIVGELYIAHADHDASMPAEQIARLQQALESSSVRYEAELYRGAAHGFTMADLPAYDAAALDRHWKKLLALLERTLVMQ
jgi:carboxymethylenebutenolidase